MTAHGLRTRRITQLALALALALLSVYILSGKAWADTACADDVATPDPDNNPGLVADCEACWPGKIPLLAPAH